MLAGTVETMWERTRYAAVATAASCEALAEKRRVEEVRPVCFGSIALTAS